ncbi:MAG TPA: ZIP family metal transporter [Trueperaceae bacterium]
MDGFVDLFLRVSGSNPIAQGVVGGLFIALMNLLGAVLIGVWRRPSQRSLDAALGFAAGVMLTASFTSLILPGIEIGGLLPVVVGIALGVVILDRADAWVPHVHVLVTGRLRSDAAQEAGTSDSARGRLSAVLLFIVAITLHNVPEGLAVGVGFGAGRITDALALMLAIGIQNVPEGLAVAVAARNAGMGGRSFATLTGIRAGAFELPAAVFGAWLVSAVEPLLPYAMGFAAGAMLYVILDEIVPETHTRGHERSATLGTMVGVVVMLVLDVALG